MISYEFHEFTYKLFLARSLAIFSVHIYYKIDKISNKFELQIPCTIPYKILRDLIRIVMNVFKYKLILLFYIYSEKKSAGIKN